MTLIFDAYHEEDIEGETRVVLKLHPKIAPIKAAFMPLTNKLDDATYKIFKEMQKKLDYDIQYDKSGSIGKRYRRQDEIGTPLCFTYDFESEADNSVTIRNRDTTEQQRIKITDIPNFIINYINNV